MEQARRNRIDTASATDLQANSLVGSYFHIHAEKKAGLVVAEPSPGVYLCELFARAKKDAGHQELVWLDEMRSWQFFDDAELMWDSFDGRDKVTWNRKRPESQASSG